MSFSQDPQKLASIHDEMLRDIFKIYDKDGNGQIDKVELRDSLQSELASTGIHITEEKLHHLTSSLFDTADGDGDGGICFNEFKTELEKYPDLVDKLNNSASQRLNQNVSNTIVETDLFAYLINNVQLLVFMGLYLGFNIIFFVWEGYYHYLNDGNMFYMTARACGYCLNFNGVLVLVLMLRKTLSFLRANYLYYVFPFDHTVFLHKFVGIAIAVLSFGHTIAHIGNGVVVANANTFTVIEFLLINPKLTTLGLIPGTVFITGWTLVVFLIVLVIGSLSCVRDSGYFEVFSWTHFVCYTSMFILYILHGPHLWKWFVGPVFIYFLEKLSQLPCVSYVRYGATFIKEARLLPSGVTQLVLTRPLKMHYRPGDYIFILIPAIAKYEWHPFTISSAPEQADITLHVQSRGTWTKRLYAYFHQNFGLQSRSFREKTMARSRKERFEKLTVQLNTAYTEDDDIESMEIPRSNNEDNAHLDIRSFDTKSKERIRMFIQGPYGTPSTSSFTADHAVLIGGGIGVTPFASIIQSIVCKYRRYRMCCPNCNHTLTRDMPANVIKIKKVDFIWINRSPTAFEWFLKMLSELEEQENISSMDRFFDIHLFMTAMRRDDIKNVALQLALNAAHAKHKKDALTGLRTKLQPGRPDFEKLFQQFRDQKKGKIEIFFCGSSQLGKVVKLHCQKFGFRFHTEIF